MLRFRMTRIGIGQFAILSDNIPAESVQYAINVGFGYSVDAKSIAVELTFRYENAGEKLMVLSLQCEFQIHEEDWAKAINDSTLVIHKDVLEYFVSQTIGTARGILHCKTEGTPFNHLILPPVDVANLVKDDLVVHLG